MSFFSSILRSLDESLTGKWPEPGQYAVPCPKGWLPKEAVTAQLPVKKKKVVVEDVDDNCFSDAEIEEMTETQFRLYVGGAMTKAEFFKRKAEDDKWLADHQRNKTVEFDEVSPERYGITEREYGEMLAYDPILTNLELASKVKEGLQKNQSLKVVAEKTGQKYQLIKHYSAALGRAKK